MYPTTMQHLGEARLTDMHRQAQRDALLRAARRSHRTQRQQSGHRGRGPLAAVARWARRPGLQPGS
jgi:hypothetical protein